MDFIKTESFCSLDGTVKTMKIQTADQEKQ